MWCRGILDDVDEVIGEGSAETFVQILPDTGRVEVSEVLLPRAEIDVATLPEAELRALYRRWAPVFWGLTAEGRLVALALDGADGWVSAENHDALVCHVRFAGYVPVEAKVPQGDALRALVSEHVEAMRASIEARQWDRRPLTEVGH